MNETAIIQWLEAIRTLLIRKGARLGSFDLRAQGNPSGPIRWMLTIDFHDDPELRLAGMPTAQAALEVAQKYAESYSPLPRDVQEALPQTTAFPGLAAGCAAKASP